MSTYLGLEQGRANVIASFYRFLRFNLPGGPFDANGKGAGFVVGSLSPSTVIYSLLFDHPFVVARLADGPLMVVSDKGLYDDAAWDTNDRVAINAAGEEVQGAPKQSYIEVVIWGDGQRRPDEQARILRIRDALMWLYRTAGRHTGSGATINPPMQIYDFRGSASSPIATNNYIRRNRQANWLTERFGADPERPNVLQFSGLLKLEWTEVWQPQ